METMPLRNNTFDQGELYHILNRGANKATIFSNSGNYDYLIRLVEKYSERFGIGVVCYCLMPNHYHFLLQQTTDQSLSAFINTVFNAYVQAYNRQRHRTGTLFEGRFRHVHVDRQEYLLTLISYIHLNPVAAFLTSEPEAWEFSDCRDWIKKSDCADSRIVKYRTQFGLPSPEEYRKILADAQYARIEDKKFDKYLLDRENLTSRRF